MEVQHDGADEDLLPSVSKGDVGVVEPEARSTPTIFPENFIVPVPQKWDFCTRMQVQKLRKVGLESDTLFFIRNHYTCHDAVENYLRNMSDEQKAVCLKLKLSTRLAVNQRNFRAKKSRDIKTLKAKRDEYRRKLAASKDRLQSLKNELGHAKVAFCDLLLDIGKQAAEKGIELPAWIQDI